MKKFLSILLALVMVLSLSTVAFAAEDGETTTDPNSKIFETVTDDPETTEVVENETSFDVKTKANVTPDGAYANIAYSVKVEWEVDAADIDVNNGDVYTWNHETLTYVKDDTASASKVGASDSVGVKITLTNSSNAAVNYTVAYADKTDDVFTTSEAAKTGSEKTGTIATADTLEGVATASTVDSFDYDIDFEKQGEKTGEAQTATYEGTVKVTEISDTTSLTDAADITLGTYTVTLSSTSTKTIAEILQAVDNFPTTEQAGWISTTEDSKLFISEGEWLYVTATGAIKINTSATKNGSGNYVAERQEDLGGGSVITQTYTFVMDGDELTQIILVTKQTNFEAHTYTFNAPTDD